MALVQMFTLDQAAIIGVICAFIILLNSVEIFFLLKKGNKKLNHETLILSLSMSDLLVGISTGIFKLIVVLYRLKAVSLSQFGISELSIYMGVLIWFSIYASLFHITGITADRYVAVRYPFRHKIWITPYRTKLFTLIIWLLSLTIASLSVTGAIFYAGRSEHKLTDNRVKTVLSAFGLFVGCLLAFWYASIVKTAIFSSQKASKHQNEKLNQANLAHKEHKERRLLGVCFAIVMSFFLCMASFSIEVFISGTNTAYTCFLLVCSSLFNPVIYFYSKYRNRKE